MALVKVKQTFQVVILESVRKPVPLAVGDMLEVAAQGRVTDGWRFYFRIVGDTCAILSIVPHPK